MLSESRISLEVSLKAHILGTRQPPAHPVCSVELCFVGEPKVIVAADLEALSAGMCSLLIL